MKFTVLGITVACCHHKYSYQNVCPGVEGKAKQVDWLRCASRQEGVWGPYNCFQIVLGGTNGIAGPRDNLERCVLCRDKVAKSIDAGRGRTSTIQAGSVVWNNATSHPFLYLPFVLFTTDPNRASTPNAVIRI
jgi:hypothetical protein